jgi:hypothetical protein
MRLISFFYLILISQISICQELDSITVKNTNLRISNSMTLCNKIDTTYSHGESTYYKRYLGFIRIRTGRGGIVNWNILCDSILIKHITSSTEFRKNSDYHNLDNYYFHNNELIKYENIYFVTSSINKHDSLYHKITLYFKHDLPIHTETIVNDGMRINDKRIEQILNYSKDLINDSKYLFFSTAPDK